MDERQVLLTVWVPRLLIAVHTKMSTGGLTETL